MCLVKKATVLEKSPINSLYSHFFLKRRHFCFARFFFKKKTNYCFLHCRLPLMTSALERRPPIPPHPPSFSSSSPLSASTPFHPVLTRRGHPRRKGGGRKSENGPSQSGRGTVLQKKLKNKKETNAERPAFKEMASIIHNVAFLRSASKRRRHNGSILYGIS